MKMKNIVHNQVLTEVHVKLHVSQIYAGIYSLNQLMAYSAHIDHTLHALTC